MTQYKRITGKVFGGNATATGNDPQIAQFGSALANTFVGTTDPETIQQLPAWGEGWIGAVTPETQFPPLPEMTGAMKVLSHQICGILQQGVSTWDNDTIYYTGNFCSKNGIVYVSLVDENQGNDPEVDTTNWRSYGGADIDLSNLSSQGKNIANWSTNVTNCITEIPQNINLVQNNDLVTLKTGSKVIIEGEQYTIPSDATLIGALSDERMLAYEKSGNRILGYVASKVGSGDTLPADGTQYQFFYLSTDKKCYRWVNNTWNASAGHSMPIAHVVGSGAGNPLTIKQIFNGFGYIGSTIWADKGIKYLVANGRNEDGTLKNIEHVVDEVRFRDVKSASNQQNLYWFIWGHTTHWVHWTSEYYISDVEPITSTQGAIWYNPTKNEIYAYSVATGKWVKSTIYFPLGQNAILFNSSGKISELYARQSLRAVDYNDALLKTDKTEITSWGFPSNKRIRLTNPEFTYHSDELLGQYYSGKITAPADGWFAFIDEFNANDSYIQCKNTANGMIFQTPNSNTVGYHCFTLPFKKNDECTISYTNAPKSLVIEFIYAQGGK